MVWLLVCSYWACNNWGGSGGMLSSKFMQFKCSEIVSEAIFRPRQWPDDRSPYQHEYLLRCPLHLMVLVSASQSITWRIESSWSSRRLGRDSFTLLSYSLASTCCISPANVHSICVWTSRGHPPSHDTLATLSKPKVRETGIHQVPRVLYVHWLHAENFDINYIHSSNYSNFSMSLLQNNLWQWLDSYK